MLAVDGSSLSPQQMIGERLLPGLSILVLFFALVQDNVDDFVMLADVLRRLGHKGIYDFTEQGNVASGILANS